MRLVPVIGLVLGLAACGDPFAGVDRLGDVDVVPTDPVAAALPDAQEVAREGFLGTSAARGDVPEGVAAPVAQAPAQGGFFRGLIRRAANADPAAAVAAQVAQSQSGQVVIATEAVTTDGAASDAVAVGAEAPVELAALAPEPEPRGGLFGSRTAPQAPGAAPQAGPARTGPDARDVGFGEMVPFGEIARVCDAEGKSLGKQVASLGRRGFALYDTDTGGTQQRTFYITGFGDGCPRQFTAANALFGAPSFYETIRFGPAGRHLPYAATDTAYDRVKSSVCRVGKDKPCGNQIDALDGELAFVSAYEFSEINDKWKEFLIYKGTVLAGAVKAY